MLFALRMRLIPLGRKEWLEAQTELLFNFWMDSILFLCFVKRACAALHLKILFYFWICAIYGSWNELVDLASMVLLMKATTRSPLMSGSVHLLLCIFWSSLSLGCDSEVRSLLLGSSKRLLLWLCIIIYWFKCPSQSKSSPHNSPETQSSSPIWYTYSYPGSLLHP